MFTTVRHLTATIVDLNIQTLRFLFPRIEERAIQKLRGIALCFNFILYFCRNTRSDELMFLFYNSTVNKDSCILYIITTRSETTRVSDL